MAWSPCGVGWPGGGVAMGAGGRAGTDWPLSQRPPCLFLYKLAQDLPADPRGCVSSSLPASHPALSGLPCSPPQTLHLKPSARAESLSWQPALPAGRLSASGQPNSRGTENSRPQHLLVPRSGGLWQVLWRRSPAEKGCGKRALLGIP